MIAGNRALRWSGRLFACAFAGFMLLPLVIILIASLTNEGYVRFPPSSFGLRWYAAAFANSAFMNGLVFSLQVAAIVALLSGTLGVAGALVLARRKFAGSAVIAGVLMAPLALPHIVLAIALLQLFGAVGIPSSPYGLVAGHVLITLPYVLRLSMTSLAGLELQLERASYSLGASAWQTLRRVTLPMIAPGVVAGVMFAFLLSFDEVTISLFTAMPGRTTLPAEIFNFAMEGSDPVITAVSGIMVVLATGLMLVVERFFGVLRLITHEH